MAVELGKGTGPLRGVRVVELAGIGPGPHACTLLADLGADVIRVDRPGGQPWATGRHDLLTRGRPSIALDLKHPDAVSTVLRLVESADVLVEGLRPGVTERLGLGPDACLARNPRLVYGRMTGWGQSGPLASTAGHDIDYVAVAGALFGLGQDPARPHFPANLVGDFGGGSTYLVIGLLAALLEARASGRGQVVDAAIVDGVAHLNAMAAGHLAAGLTTEQRAANLLDGGAPYYEVYETADGRASRGGCAGASVLRRPARRPRHRRHCPRPRRPRQPRGPARADRLHDPLADPGRVDRGLRRHRRVRRACAPVQRGGAPPAHRRPGGVRRPGRRPRAGAGAAVLPHRSDALLATARPRRQHTREALAAWGIDDVESLLESGAAFQA